MVRPFKEDWILDEDMLCWECGAYWVCEHKAHIKEVIEEELNKADELYRQEINRLIEILIEIETNQLLYGQNDISPGFQINTKHFPPPS